MKITTRGRYGLRAIVDLASQEKDKCVTLKSIAERLNISEHYLEQLIAPMKKAGFVKSVRGAQGGYHLNVEPSTLSVGSILRVLEGTLKPVPCADNNSDAPCGDAPCEACVARGVWEKMYKSINDTMDSITLSDLVSDYRNLQEEEK